LAHPATDARTSPKQNAENRVGTGSVAYLIEHEELRVWSNGLGNDILEINHI
jgi:hypothetical protein